MRAVAILMEDTQIHNMVEKVAQRIKLTMAKLQEHRDNIRSAMEEIREVAASNAGTIEEFRYEVLTMGERLKEAAEEM